MGVITYKDYIIEPEDNTRFTLKKSAPLLLLRGINSLGRDFELMGSSSGMSACISKIILDLSIQDMDDAVELTNTG